MGIKIVVHGATCMCKFAPGTDKLKVLTNKKEYANDSSGSDKAIATDKDIGSVFESGCFGPCKKKPHSAPCKSIVTEWSNVYEEVKLQNGGNPLLETSKATCPIGGKDCITVVQHGQQAEASAQNVKNVDEQVQSQINPFVDIKKLDSEEIVPIKLNS